MVPKKQIIKGLVGFGVRFLILPIVFIIGFFTAHPFYQLNAEVFHFQNPSGFFISSWADGVLAWSLSSLFLAGIIFGTLGRRIDYFFITIFLLFGLWNYIYTDNVTPQMYLGLIGTAVVSIAIGYALKLLRMRVFRS